MTGDGFEVRPAELPGLIRRWEQMLERAVGHRERIGAIRSAGGPAPDLASELSAAAIRATGEALWRQNEENIAYARDWLDRLRRARADYEAVERANGALFDAGHLP
jgi:hypothetical protein